MKYICQYCGCEIEIETDGDFNEWGEEELWGHIQMQHEDVFDDYQDLETPDMIELCYDEEE